MGRPTEMQRPVAEADGRAERDYLAWRGSCERRFRSLSAGEVSAEAVDRHVGSMVASRAAWGPADDFSHAFADPQLAAEHRAGFNQQRSTDE
jgi:hypothetical protein